MGMSGNEFKKSYTFLDSITGKRGTIDLFPNTLVGTRDLEDMGIIRREKEYPVDNIPLGGALGNFYRRLDSGNLFHG